MKKGFIFALLMVGMVAMTMPAGALAPVMPTMPDIVIGDAGDIAGSGTPALRLLRYINVADLAGAIGRPNNPSTASALSVWYTSGDTSGLLKASNAAAIVEPMTSAEASALTSTGAQPPTAKKIGGAAWLSLIYGKPGAGASTYPTSAISATPTSNGATSAQYSTKGITTNPITLRLYAIDSDSLTTAVGTTNPFKVYARIDAEDGFSPADVAYTADFEGGVDGWTTLTYPALSPPYQVATGFSQTATAIGHTGVASFSSGNTGAYAQWYSPVTPPTVDVTGSAGKIFKATMTMSGDAAAAGGTPGFRFLYLSTGFCHVGGFQVYSLNGSGLPVNNLPFSGTQKVVRMAWETPYDLSDYGDGGQLDHVANASIDLRDYYVIFDLVQLEAGETASIMMEDFTITRSPRPLDAAPVLKYGAASANINGAGIAFSVPASQGGWQVLPGDFGTGFGEGTATVGADTMLLNRGTAGGADGSGFKQVAPFATATNMPAWASNQLLRYSIRIAASNPLAYPAMRFFLLPYSGVGLTATLQDLVWVDSFDGTGMRGWYGPSGRTALGGSPKSGGSLLRFYAYSHTAASGSPIILPSMDIAQGPITNYNGWTGATDSNMTVSAYSVEVLSP
jgi:hypothetical protein